jgi:hypothetical protein
MASLHLGAARTTRVSDSEAGSYYTTGEDQLRDARRVAMPATRSSTREQTDLGTKNGIVPKPVDLLM